MCECICTYVHGHICIMFPCDRSQWLKPKFYSHYAFEIRHIYAYFLAIVGNAKYTSPHTFFILFASKMRFCECCWFLCVLYYFCSLLVKRFPCTVMRRKVLNLESYILYLCGSLTWGLIYERSGQGPLARYAKLLVRMRRECRERFPPHRR